MSTKAPNPVDKYVGSRVRMRRIMLGMSQEKLGEALGLTFQQVQKYEKGTNRVGASRLQQISEILQVPVSFLFDGGPSGAVNGNGFAEGGDAVVGVAAVFGFVDLLGHAAADGLGGHGVVFADAEIEELPLGVVGERFTFGALDFFKLVDGGAFAVVGAADSVCEERLEVGVGHR